MSYRPAQPKLQTTTLWYHPSQQYGDQVMGTPAYEGATPAYILWNLLTRYTREEDLVVDPFVGGGTTIDVALSLGRKVIGYDLRPIREDIIQANARDLPLEDEQADFVFMDPPYSTHIEYSGESDCIGELSAFEESYFEAMQIVFDEAYRVLKNRRYLGVYVSDSFKRKKGFVGIGSLFFNMLAERFKPIDHVAVVRGNRKLEKPNFHKAAAEQNFFMRGFNHLLIFKKDEEQEEEPRQIARQQRSTQPGSGRRAGGRPGSGRGGRRR